MCLLVCLFLIKSHLDILCQICKLFWSPSILLTYFSDGQKQQSSYTLNWFTYGLNIAKLITFWNKLIKSKRQKCKSYDTLAGAADDYFMLSKFISFLCNYCWTFPSNYNLSDEKINFGFAVTQELNQLKKKKKKKKIVK